MNVYVFQAALLCEACGEAARADTPTPAGYDADCESSWDSDDYPKGPYSDGGGEADCPQHCDHCNTFLENPLTSDGEEYVRDLARLGGCPPDWRDCYSYLFNAQESSDA